MRYLAVCYPARSNDYSIGRETLRTNDTTTIGAQETFGKGMGGGGEGPGGSERELSSTTRRVCFQQGVCRSGPTICGHPRRRSESGLFILPLSEPSIYTGFLSVEKVPWD